MLLLSRNDLQDIIEYATCAIHTIDHGLNRELRRDTPRPLNVRRHIEIANSDIEDILKIVNHSLAEYVKINK